MDIRELVDIIKEEKLYEYQCFQIGDPKDKKNSIWTSAENSDSETYGILKNESGIWQQYSINERGSIIFSEKKFTESTACENLLKGMRIHKNYMVAYHHPKLKYIIHNPEKWFYN